EAADLLGAGAISLWVRISAPDDAAISRWHRTTEHGSVPAQPSPPSTEALTERRVDVRTIPPTGQALDAVYLADVGGWRVGELRGCVRLERGAVRRRPRSWSASSLSRTGLPSRRRNPAWPPPKPSLRRNAVSWTRS